MGFISGLFRKREQAEPERLYVVTGDPHHVFEEPAYATDPRHYGLPLFKTPISDEQFGRDYRNKVKAFSKRDDAIRFAYHCNLAGVMCPVYDRVDGKWVYNPEETEKVADDIN